MSLAVNASTLGMAIAGLAVAFFSRRIDRRLGILLSLTLLSIPTALLASAPDLTTFALLRIVQGVFMATAFALTLAYLGEACSAEDTGGAFAAYITGNVASNLIGRLISAAVADHLGLATNFYVFAALNLAGAVLVYFTISRTKPMDAAEPIPSSPFAIWGVHLRNAQLRASFAVGFVGRAATTDRGSARGIYLSCYFCGGLVGSAVLGQLFDRFGWAACVAGIGLSLIVAAVLAVRLKMPAVPAMASAA